MTQKANVESSSGHGLHSIVSMLVSWHTISPMFGRIPQTMPAALTGVLMLVAGCSTPGAPSVVPSPSPTVSPSAPTQSAQPTPSAEPSILECAPGCILPGANYEPGALTAGTYTTRYFLGHALTITVPEGWSGGEDNRREFNLGPSSGQDTGGIVFWEDGKPPAKNSVLPAPGVPDTAAGVLAWLQASTGFAVSRPVSGMIGKLPATVVDIVPRLSEPNEVNFMTWTDFPDGPLYAFGAPRVIRLYLADITYGGTPHLLMALVTAPNRARLQAWLPEAIPIIASATAPVSPG